MKRLLAILLTLCLLCTCLPAFAEGAPADGAAALAGELTDAPASDPTQPPADDPTDAPKDAPTEAPKQAPTDVPTDAPTDDPTGSPADLPTDTPTDAPVLAPTDAPTGDPTDTPASESPAPTLEELTLAADEALAAFDAAVAALFDAHFLYADDGVTVLFNADTSLTDAREAQLHARGLWTALRDANAALSAFKAANADSGASPEANADGGETAPSASEALLTAMESALCDALYAQCLDANEGFAEDVEIWHARPQTADGLHALVASFQSTSEFTPPAAQVVADADALLTQGDSAWKALASAVFRPTVGKAYYFGRDENLMHIIFPYLTGKSGTLTLYQTFDNEDNGTLTVDKAITIDMNGFVMKQSSMEPKLSIVLTASTSKLIFKNSAGMRKTVIDSAIKLSAAAKAELTFEALRVRNSLSIDETSGAFTLTAKDCALSSAVWSGASTAKANVNLTGCTVGGMQCTLLADVTLTNCDGNDLALNMDAKGGSITLAETFLTHERGTLTAAKVKLTSAHSIALTTPVEDGISCGFAGKIACASLEASNAWVSALTPTGDGALSCMLGGSVLFYLALPADLGTFAEGKGFTLTLTAPNVLNFALQTEFADTSRVSVVNAAGSPVMTAGTNDSAWATLLKAADAQHQYAVVYSGGLLVWGRNASAVTACIKAFSADQNPATIMKIGTFTSATELPDLPLILSDGFTVTTTGALKLTKPLTLTGTDTRLTVGGALTVTGNLGLTNNANLKAGNMTVAAGATLTMNGSVMEVNKLSYAGTVSLATAEGKGSVARIATQLEPLKGGTMTLDTAILRVPLIRCDAAVKGGALTIPLGSFIQVPTNITLNEGMKLHLWDSNVTDAIVLQKGAELTLTINGGPTYSYVLSKGKASIVTGLANSHNADEAAENPNIFYIDGEGESFTIAPKAELTLARGLTIVGTVNGNVVYPGVQEYITAVKALPASITSVNVSTAWVKVAQALTLYGELTQDQLDGSRFADIAAACSKLFRLVADCRSRLVSRGIVTYEIDAPLLFARSADAPTCEMNITPKHVTKSGVSTELLFRDLTGLADCFVVLPDMPYDLLLRDPAAFASAKDARLRPFSGFPSAVVDVTLRSKLHAEDQEAFYRLFYTTPSMLVTLSSVTLLKFTDVKSDVLTVDVTVDDGYFTLSDRETLAATADITVYNTARPADTNGFSLVLGGYELTMNLLRSFAFANAVSCRLSDGNGVSYNPELSSTVSFVKALGGTELVNDALHANLYSVGDEYFVTLAAVSPISKGTYKGFLRLAYGGNVSYSMPVTLKVSASAPKLTVRPAVKLFVNGGANQQVALISALNGVETDTYCFPANLAPYVEGTFPLDETFSLVTTPSGATALRVNDGVTLQKKTYVTYVNLIAGRLGGDEYRYERVKVVIPAVTDEIIPAPAAVTLAQNSTRAKLVFTLRLNSKVKLQKTDTLETVLYTARSPQLSGDIADCFEVSDWRTNPDGTAKLVLAQKSGVPLPEQKLLTGSISAQGVLWGAGQTQGALVPMTAPLTVKLLPPQLLLAKSTVTLDLNGADWLTVLKIKSTTLGQLSAVERYTCYDVLQPDVPLQPFRFLYDEMPNTKTMALMFDAPREPTSPLQAGHTYRVTLTMSDTDGTEASTVLTVKTVKSTKGTFSVNRTKGYLNTNLNDSLTFILKSTIGWAGDHPIRVEFASPEEEALFTEPEFSGEASQFPRLAGKVTFRLANPFAAAPGVYTVTFVTTNLAGDVKRLPVRITITDELPKLKVSASGRNVYCTQGAVLKFTLSGKFGLEELDPNSISFSATLTDAAKAKIIANAARVNRTPEELTTLLQQLIGTQRSSVSKLTFTATLFNDYVPCPLFARAYGSTTLPITSEVTLAGHTFTVNSVMKLADPSVKFSAPSVTLNKLAPYWAQRLNIFASSALFVDTRLYTLTLDAKSAQKYTISYVDDYYQAVRIGYKNVLASAFCKAVETVTVTLTHPYLCKSYTFKLKVYNQ